MLSLLPKQLKYLCTSGLIPHNAGCYCIKRTHLLSTLDAAFLFTQRPKAYSMQTAETDKLLVTIAALAHYRPDPVHKQAQS